MSARALENSELRALLMRLEDIEFTILCRDYFLEVSLNFSAGLTKGHKVQLLIEHCQSREQQPYLLDILYKKHPYLFVNSSGLPPIPTTPTTSQSFSKNPWVGAGIVLSIGFIVAIVWPLQQWLQNGKANVQNTSEFSATVASDMSQLVDTTPTSVQILSPLIDTPDPTHTPVETTIHTPAFTDTQTPTITPSPTITNTPSPTVVPQAIVISSTNLRPGPGTNYDIIRDLKVGEILTVLSTHTLTGGYIWMNVITENDNKMGWVYSEYIEPTGSNILDNIPTPATIPPLPSATTTSVFIPTSAPVEPTLKPGGPNPTKTPVVPTEPPPPTNTPKPTPPKPKEP